MRICMILLVAGATVFCCGGCANVKPWEQMVHGSEVMRSDRDPLADLFSEHVHFTREGASGGRGVGGGGCGCN